MSEDKAREQASHLALFLKGDVDAMRLCEQVFFITQVWDDLVDADQAVDPEDVNRAFWLALVELPANPFYQKHQSQLAPLMRGWITDWQDATQLEAGPAEARNLAYVLRDTVGAIVSQCAYLVGGYEWLRQVSPDVRRMIHDEPLTTYLRRLP